MVFQKVLLKSALHIKGGGQIVGKNKNTLKSCWSNKLMCFDSDMLKAYQYHYGYILAYPFKFVYRQIDEIYFFERWLFYDQ